MIPLALLLAVQSVAVADAAPEPIDACQDMVTQADMTQCAWQDFEKADAELNAQWKLTAAAMKARDRHVDDDRPGDFDTLLAAQRAWLTYRDQHCLGEGFLMRGGSAEPMLRGSCKAELTRQRTKQLQELIGDY